MLFIALWIITFSRIAKIHVNFACTAFTYLSNDFASIKKNQRFHILWCLFARLSFIFVKRRQSYRKNAKEWAKFLLGESMCFWNLNLVLHSLSSKLSSSSNYSLKKTDDRKLKKNQEARMKKTHSTKWKRAVLLGLAKNKSVKYMKKKIKNEIKFVSSRLYVCVFVGCLIVSLNLFHIFFVIILW